ARRAAEQIYLLGRAAAYLRRSQSSARRAAGYGLPRTSYFLLITCPAGPPHFPPSIFNFFSCFSEKQSLTL
ncbi:hypothetical protein, partial [uncultured Alistipes sp.]|uniref:hypothetical protein n=1 Tax=uncultured Alistipes sp. TaxID=538949 RepID=UPI00260FF4C6